MHRAKANIVLTQKAERFRTPLFPRHSGPKTTSRLDRRFVVLFKLITGGCDCATNGSYFSNGEEAVSRDA